MATAGEEARRPQKSIPFAVVVSLLVVFLAYFGVSSVLTLMMPYYMQVVTQFQVNATLFRLFHLFHLYISCSQDEKAPFPFVYDQLGWTWAKYAVSVGAICALLSR